MEIDSAFHFQIMPTASIFLNSKELFLSLEDNIAECRWKQIHKQESVVCDMNLCVKTTREVAFKLVLIAEFNVDKIFWWQTDFIIIIVFIINVKSKVHVW